METIIFVVVIIFGIETIAFCFYLALAIRVFKEEERATVEVFGRYYKTVGPGLALIFPIIMRARAIVQIWEVAVPLFEEPMKIDFKDGSATPRNSEVFVKIKSPDHAYSVNGDLPRSGVYRSVYLINNPRAAIRDLSENAVRSYLNRLTIDEAISMAKAGFDLANYDPNLGLPTDELNRVMAVLATWGFTLERITVGDFDLESSLVKARGLVQIRQREAEASRYVSERRAEETAGSYIHMISKIEGKTVEQVQGETARSSKRRKDSRIFAQDLTKSRMGLDGNGYLHICVEGAEGVERVILNALAASQRIPKGRGEQSQEGSAETDSADNLPEETSIGPSRGKRSSKEELRRLRTEHAKQLDKEKKEKKKSGKEES